MKDSNQNNPNAGPFLSPRCNSKCKKSGPHFRYASTSTWVHGQCKTCDGEQTVRAARSTLPAGVTVRKTFTSAAHSSARCDNIVRAGRRVDLLNIFRHKLCFPVFVLCMLIAVGFLVRFAQRELEWQRIGFPNYTLNFGEFLFQKKTEQGCANGYFDCVYCSGDIDHYLSLYDIFFCSTWE